VHVLFEDCTEGLDGLQLVIGRCRGHPTDGGVDGLEGMNDFVFRGNVRCREVMRAKLDSITDNDGS